MYMSSFLPAITVSFKLNLAAVFGKSFNLRPLSLSSPLKFASSNTLGIKPAIFILLLLIQNFIQRIRTFKFTIFNVKYKNTSSFLFYGLMIFFPLCIYLFFVFTFKHKFFVLLLNLCVCVFVQQSHFDTTINADYRIFFNDLPAFFLFTQDVVCFTFIEHFYTDIFISHPEWFFSSLLRIYTIRKCFVSRRSI